MAFKNFAMFFKDKLIHLLKLYKVIMQNVIFACWCMLGTVGGNPTTWGTFTLPYLACYSRNSLSGSSYEFSMLFLR